MVDCLTPSLFQEIPSEIDSLCSPPRWRPASINSSSRSSSSSSDLVPLVEVLVFSRECGALILSPCRVRSMIEERKHLYNWEHVKKKSKQLPYNGSLYNSASAEYEIASCGSPEEKISFCENAMDIKDPERDNLSPLIGSGGFGTVFASEYNNKKVAIKQLHHKRHSSSFDFWSMCAELNAFRLSYSPNVASTLSFISCDPFVQIVTEFVCGRDLQKCIDDDQWIINSEQRRFIAFQVANALAHCHSHCLLHLDVKPSNVLLSDNFSTCKLTDFGCSRIANRTSEGLLIAPDSVSTSSFGTIAYKAPELLKGDRPSDRADIYSFSLLLYELLSRRAPYPGFHPHTIIYLVASKNMRPELCEVKEKLFQDGLNFIDSGLINLVEQCWAPDYASRPASATVCKLVQELASD